MKKNKRLIFALSFLFLLLIIINVNALSYPPPYLDEECYHGQCEKRELIFNKQTGECVYYPIFNRTQISPDGSADLANDAKNKEEFLNLGSDSQILLNKIYNKCIKGPLEERKIFSIKSFLKFLLFVLSIVLISWLIDRIIKRRKGKRHFFLLLLFVLCSFSITQV